MNFPARSPLCRGLVFCALLICAASLGAAAPSKESKPAKTSVKAAPAAEPELPQSVFTIPTNSKEGKDPFFPHRNVVGVAPGPKPNPRVVAPPVRLTLNGLSGTRQRPLAIINGRTLEKGEEGEIVTSGGRIRVRCVEIKEDSVVIEVNGQRQELRMRSGA